MKKKPGTMNFILIIIAVFLLSFTVLMIWLYKTTGGYPEALCGSVFGFCGGECGVMAWIKTTKERKRERAYELQDRKYEKLQNEIGG